jgi:3-methyladenine DNA glycosylase AlkC
MLALRIPNAPKSIKKGFPLKLILDKQAVEQLGKNLQYVHPVFDKEAFVIEALKDIEDLGIKDRSEKIADTMQKFLPESYSEAIAVILQSLTPPLEKTEGNGLSGLFYMPHCSYVAKYGVDSKYNKGKDPFHVSMNAQYKLTQRFTCEYSIRPFIEKDQNRTLEILLRWMKDSNPHIRRLCSEGPRPRLPWSTKLEQLVKDPGPVLPILEALKNDPDLYVRRSVANHVGDIAKDHLDLALNLCEKWLQGASKELKWVIRHAVRNPVKRGNNRAVAIRKAAK